MSRSRRKSPFCGFTTAESDKAWKQQSARQARRIAHQVIGQTLDGDAVPDRRAIGDCYGLKDGKQRLRSEEQTSELQSLMSISYAVFFSNKKQNHLNTKN